MPRSKKGVHSLKKRRTVLSATKGFRFGRSTKERLAREALLHAWKYAYEHRRMKKRDMRGLWNIRINAGARNHDTSYSKLIGTLKKKNVLLNRKILSLLSEKESRVFEKVIAFVKE